MDSTTSTNDGVDHKQIVVCVASQKGGVGKTTTTFQLAAAFQRMGKSVLLIDMDPHSWLTEHALPDDSKPHYWIENVCMDNLRAGSAIVSSNIKGVDIIPASPKLSYLEREIILGNVDMFKIMRNIETDRKVASYDIVMIDSINTMGYTATLALMMAQDVLIPMYDRDGIRGVHKLWGLIDTLRKDTNPKLKTPNIVIVKNDVRTNEGKRIVQQIRDEFNERVMDSVVGQYASINTSYNHDMSVFDYDPESQGAKDIENLAIELLERWNKHE